MEPQNLQTLSRFPFISAASDFIKNLNLSLDSLLDAIAYRSAWSRGKQRLFDAIDYGILQEPGITTDPEYINELISYVIARIIVSCIKEQYLVRRYALAEAAYAYQELQNRNAKFISEVGAQSDIESEEIEENKLGLKIVDYLRYSISIHAPEWKLVNRDLTNGQVVITKRELARLIQEALRLKILDDLPIEIAPKLKEKIIPKIWDISKLVQSKKQKFEAHDLGKVSITRFPPCMKNLLGMTQSGENVPHVGRFALASFLHSIGLSSEQILKVYSTSPDFDVNKARYQVEHITGKISGTEYTPPSCDTMKSNSECNNPDELCRKEWLNHPLTYYRIKGKKKGSAKKNFVEEKKEKEK